MMISREWLGASTAEGFWPSIGDAVTWRLAELMRIARQGTSSVRIIRGPRFGKRTDIRQCVSIHDENRGKWQEKCRHWRIRSRKCRSFLWLRFGNEVQ